MANEEFYRGQRKQSSESGLLVHGHPRGFYVDGDLWIPHGPGNSNTLLYDWATIVSELLRGTPDGLQYRISAFYIEFENNGGAEVTPPVITRDGGISYYDSLLTDPNRDYQRVPIVGALMESTDLLLFPRGNKVTYSTQTSTETTAGVHGKPFSDALSSRVYGGALVATPRFSDATLDLVFARFYFDDPDEQMIKLPGRQLGIKWPVVFS